MPTIVVARASYRANRLFRSAVVASALVAFLLTCPPSPFFIGLDGPIQLSIAWNLFTGIPIVAKLAVWQCYLINASTIAAGLMMPVNAVYTATRLRSVRTQPTHHASQ